MVLLKTFNADNNKHNFVSAAIIFNETKSYPKDNISSWVGYFIFNDWGMIGYKLLGLYLNILLS